MKVAACDTTILTPYPCLPQNAIFESRFLFSGTKRGRAGNGPTQPCSSRTVADREGAGDQARSYPMSQRCVILCGFDDSYILRVEY